MSARILAFTPRRAASLCRPASAPIMDARTDLLLEQARGASAHVVEFCDDEREAFASGQPTLDHGPFLKSATRAAAQGLLALIDLGGKSNTALPLRRALCAYLLEQSQ